MILSNHDLLSTHRDRVPVWRFERLMRDALVELRQANAQSPSRERSLAITNLEQAIMWSACASGAVV